MANRVNTKFVVILVGAIVVVFGAVAGVATYTLSHRGDRLIERGDALMAEGKVKEAAEQYARAVNKDPSRLDWLQKWYAVLIQEKPTTRNEIDEKYGLYLNVLRKLAILQPKNFEAQKTYLVELDKRNGRNRAIPQVADAFATEVADAIGRLGADTPEAKKLQRYRGITLVAIHNQGTTTDEKRAQARTDLQTALEADPDDADASLALANWHTQEADRLRTAGSGALADAELAEARKQFDALLERHPDYILGKLTRQIVEATEQMRGLTSLAEKLKIAKGQTSEAAAIVTAAAKLDPATMDSDELGALYERARSTGDKSLLEQFSGLARNVVEKRPDDYDSRMIYAAALRDGEKYDEAIAEYQKVMDQPPMVVGFMSSRLPDSQVQAVFNQVECALMKAGAAGEGAARAAAMTQARQFRDKLAAMATSQQQDLVKMCDGRLALMEAKYDTAIAKFSELRSSPYFSRNVAARSQVLWLLAVSLESVKNLGEARKVLEERLKLPLESANVDTLTRLAEIHIQLDDAETAKNYYEKAVEFAPENEALRARLRTIQTALGNNKNPDQVDPIVKQIIEARKKRNAKDAAGAREILEQLAKTNATDYRVVRERMELELTEGDKAAALRIVNDAVAAAPEEKRFKSMKTQLEIDDPVKSAEMIIADSDLSPVNKLLARGEIYMRYNKTEEAKKVLTEAETMEPENTDVLERVFVMALGTNDLERARQVIPKAARLNADQVGGLLFQGRLELVEGKCREATNTLTQVVQKIPHLPIAWRFLGQANLRCGRVNEAVDAFERSLEGRPNDVETVRQYVAALMQLGRCAEALKAIEPDHGGLRFAPNDKQLVMTWLTLEGQCGDKDKAIKTRTEYLQMDPTDESNVMALTELLQDRGQWADTQAVIDAYAKTEKADPLLLTALRADLLGKQGKLDEGAQQYQAYLAAIPRESQTAREWLAYAQFLIKFDRTDDALAAMRAAREFQSSSLREADRRLGDYSFEVGGDTFNRHLSLNSQIAAEPADSTRIDDLQAQADDAKKNALNYLDEAAKAYRSVIEGGAAEDPERSVQKRLAETLLRLQRLDEAGKVLDDLAKTNEKDLQVLLLRANLAESKNDRRIARQFLDQAVQLYPDIALSFMRRAIFNYDDNNLASDVMQDLDQVLRLQPRNIEARRMKFDLRMRRNEKDMAFAELRKGVDDNASDDELRLMMLKELLRSGQYDVAAQEALAAVKARADDERWARAAAMLMMQGGRFCDAAELYRLFDEKSKTPRSAGMYLDALLRCPTRTPTPAVVQELLARFNNAANADNPNDIMLQCRALWFLGSVDQKSEAARAAAIDKAKVAYKICGQDADCLQKWFNQIKVVTGSFKEAEKVIRDLGKTETLPDYLLVMLMAIEMTDLKTTDDRVRAMIKECDDFLAKPDQNVVTRFHANGLKHRGYYRLNDIQAAVDAGKEALKANPRDAELNNNIAYMLANDLKKVDEAIPFAERAAKLAPDSSPTLDTVGWIYYQKGDYAKAEETLDMALRRAKPDRDDEKIVAQVHLGMAKLKRNDRSGARECLVKAQEIARTTPQVGLRFTQDVEMLRKAVDEVN
ncbi:MAG TPA: tetratricopeptide repeat protein [Phycisphaerales bacterium]|nr:tetratricopeptide repeat protein [Phycisphaerales bacterium]